MNVEELHAEASHLTRYEKGQLISRLLNDFGTPSYQVSDEEVSQRVSETQSGTVQDISHEQLLSGLDHIPNS